MKPIVKAMWKASSVVHWDKQNKKLHSNIIKYCHLGIHHQVQDKQDKYVPFAMPLPQLTNVYLQSCYKKG
jgi:hypothetical protein